MLVRVEGMLFSLQALYESHQTIPTRTRKHKKVRYSAIFHSAAIDARDFPSQALTVNQQYPGTCTVRHLQCI